MFALTFYLLPLLYLTLSISEDEFIIVSTTQNPSEKQEIKELKSRLETLESKNKQSTADEIQYRLELLELKNKQITVNENINSFVKRLEVLLESKNEQSKVIYEKINKFQHTLEVEFKNNQRATDEKINNIFDTFDTLDSKIKETHHKLDVLKSKNEQSVNGEKINTILDKFDTLDSKIKEIAQTLGTMNQTLSQSTNYIDAVLPKNCREVQQRGHKVSKIYKIQPDSSPKPFEVLCDMKRRGGGWTYFLNRFDGSQDFNLTWKDYKIGFGKPSGEFWLGLENIHYLTGSEINELLIELMDWDNKVVYAHYDAFSVGNESEGYFLKILGKYEGTAGNSFETNAKMKFSTKDKDQDTLPSGNCAEEHGGWWHNGCGYSVLTGEYYKENMIKTIPWYKGFQWAGFHGFQYSLQQGKMMVRSETN